MRVINLLPKSRQQEIRLEAVLAVIIRLIILSLISFAVVFLAQLGVKLYLAGESRTMAAEIDQLKSQVNKDDNNKIKQQIQDINNTVADYDTLTAAQPKWSQALRAFAKLPAPNIRIASLNIQPDGKTVNITGFAPTRDDVIQLYNTILADSREFYGIDYPLENVVKPTNINFHFTFKVQDALLK